MSSLQLLSSEVFAGWPYNLSKSIPTNADSIDRIARAVRNT